jgi:excisionase family DNA binding protein
MDSSNEKVNRLTYNMQQMAEVLGVSETSARNLSHSAGFPVLLIGRRRLVLRSALEKWLEKKSEKGN